MDQIRTVAHENRLTNKGSGEVQDISASEDTVLITSPVAFDHLLARRVPNIMVYAPAVSVTIGWQISVLTRGAWISNHAVECDPATKTTSPPGRAECRARVARSSNVG